MQKSPVRFIIIAIIYLLVLGSAYFLLWTPMSEAEQLRKQINSEEQAITVLNRTVAQRSLVQAEIVTYEQQLEKLAAMIPQSGDIPVVLMNIRQLAVENDVVLNTLNYSSLRETEQEAWYPLVMDIDGDFGLVYNFLSSLQARLPSISLNYLVVKNALDASVNLYADLILSVVTNSEDENLAWQPSDAVIMDFTSNGDVFGTPLQMIEQFYNGGVKFLGVVVTQGGNRALLNYQGSYQWVQVGSLVGQAVVNEINSKEIKFSLGNIELKLAMEGE